MLIASGVKTNIHYVLGKNTIEEAIGRLRDETFPEGVNAIIFLLHKPKGQGSLDNILVSENTNIQRFFELIDRNRHPFKVGFDSCSCAGIVNFTENIDSDSIDYCEGARYSCYIDAQMNMMPCSFAVDDKEWQVSLNRFSIEEAWRSTPFERFRNFLRSSCPRCVDRLLCGGGCPIVNQITLCDRNERFYEVKN
jgi:radical SAM protein with 4Fe4S-binding SPASM domain